MYLALPMESLPEVEGEVRGNQAGQTGCYALHPVAKVPECFWRVQAAVPVALVPEPRIPASDLPKSMARDQDGSIHHSNNLEPLLGLPLVFPLRLLWGLLLLPVVVVICWGSEQAGHRSTLVAGTETVLRRWLGRGGWGFLSLARRTRLNVRAS